jgi:hypothetical protein
MPLPFDTPPAWIENVTKLSATDFNILREAAQTLDGLSYRMMPANQSAIGAQDLPGKHPAKNYRLWWGAFRFRAGMTTLGIETNSVPEDDEVFIVYLDGVPTTTITPGAAVVTSIDISGAGYTDGQVITIEIWVAWPGDGEGTKDGYYSVMEVYAYPIVMADSYPGVPTFGTSYPASALNQLANAATWLLQRIDAVPMVVPDFTHWIQATHKVETATLGTWWVRRAQSQDQLYIAITAKIFNNQERVKIYVNNALAYTSPTWTLGQTQDLYLTVDMSTYSPSIAQHTLALVRIDAEVLNASNQVQPTKNSRYIIKAVRAQAPAAGYFTSTIPDEFEGGNVATPQTDLTTALSQIATAFTNAKARIDGNTTIWGRARAFKRRTSKDEHENSKNEPVLMYRGVRRGDRLFVKGKRVKLAWGSITLKTNDNGVIYTEFDFTRSQEIIGGDKIDTTEIFFDALDGLNVGQVYYITGDVIYAEERYL